MTFFNEENVHICWNHRLFFVAFKIIMGVTIADETLEVLKAVEEDRSISLSTATVLSVLSQLTWVETDVTEST